MIKPGLPISLYLLLSGVMWFMALPSQATDFSSLYKKVRNSVVTIQTDQFVEQQTDSGIISAQQSGLGSGVIIKGKYVLTASHVVNIADRIRVHTASGDMYAAKTISSVPLADLAIIEIINPLGDLKSATIGDSDAVSIGEEVFVIGAPYGLSQTLTVGHFSGRRLSEGKQVLLATEFLQTDAPINRGNSGGPMFNTKGEIIGIVSHISSTSGGSEGLGFAASINMAKKLFIDHPPVWTGMAFVPMSEVLADALNAPYPNGILVQQVAKGSLGDQFGVHPGRIPATIGGRNILLGGDIIISLGGQDISLTPEGIQQSLKYMRELKEGDTIRITVIRNGKKLVLTALKKKVF